MTFKKLFLALGSLFTLASCSGLDVLNLITPRSGYSVSRNIAYGNDPRQHLDVYIPTVIAPGKPVVVFFYGGSWQMGSKDDYRFAGQAFASKGFITVIADYRLYPQVYFPEFMNDAAQAFVWAHEHIREYGGNPNNLFVAGHSAGGFNAIMLALNEQYLKDAGGKTEWIKGAIGIAGPYDFLPFTDPKIKALFSKVPDAETQPITYARVGTPPLLLLSGDADTQVGLKNTVNLTAKLQGYNDNVTKKVYPGVGHIGIVLALASGFRGKAPVLDDIVNFIQQNAQK